MANFHLMAKILNMDVNDVLTMDIPMLKSLLAGVKANLSKSEERAEKHIMDEYNMEQFAGIQTAKIVMENVFGNGKQEESPQSNSKNLRAMR